MAEVSKVIMIGVLCASAYMVLGPIGLIVIGVLCYMKK